jgi:hypothetical protein
MHTIKEELLEAVAALLLLTVTLTDGRPVLSSERAPHMEKPVIVKR